MTLYRYVKRPVGTHFSAPVLPRSFAIKPKTIALLLVCIGFLFLVNVAYPIVSYQLFVSPRFATSFVNPTSEAAIAQSFAGQLAGQKEQILGKEIDLLDLTRASNWFPDSVANFEDSEVYSYLLSIPKLQIFDAQVVIGGEDLKKALIQYPGTAVPGRFGNTVIFGHSVLPQFFNPKKYVTIFSTLPTLEPKDEIIVNYNTVRYKYIVEQMIEVSPNDISILAQRYDDSYLTLITCVPPGTYLRRLIVRARLSKI